MGKVMRHTLGASLNIRHNLSSSKGPKPLQLKLLTTYIPKTSAFTLAFSTSQRLRTTRASARTFFTFRHYITPSARNSANLHTDQERDYFMQRYHDVISSFGGKTSYDADNRPLLVMRSNLWASGYDVDGTDQTSLGQFSGRVQQTYKHS